MSTMLFQSVSELDLITLIDNDYHVVFETPYGLVKAKASVLKDYNISNLQNRIAALEVAGGGTVGGVWPTARTITLAGPFTGQTSIDGSADVTLTITVPAAALPISAISGLAANLFALTSQSDDAASRLTALEGRASAVETTVDTKLDATAAAVSADKWTTARTMTLTGQVSGSVTFDGSADFSLEVSGINVTKTSIGLGNVDNTSDQDKPVSTAQAAAITAVQNDVDAIADLVALQADEIAALEAGATAAAGDLTALTGRVTTSEGEIDQLQADVLALQNDDSLETAVDTINAQITSLGSEVNTLKLTTVPALQAEIDAVEIAQTTIAGNLAATQSEVDAVEGRATLLETRATAVEGRTTTLEGRVTAVENDLQTVEDSVAVIPAQFTAVDDRLDTVEGSVVDLTTSRNSHSMRIDTLESAMPSKADTSTVDALTDRIEVLEAGGGGGGTDPALAGRVTAVEAEVDALQNEDAALDGRLDVVEAALPTKASQADLGALTARVAAVEGTDYLTEVEADLRYVRISNQPADWLTTATPAQTTNSVGWNGYTLRVRIPSSVLPLGTKLRFTLKADSVSAVVGEAYVQKASSSGDPYDFATTPLPLKVGGNTAFTVPANTSVVTDEIELPVSGSDALIVSFYLTSGALPRADGSAGWGKWDGVGNTANAVDASAYGSFVNDSAYFITGVEVYVAGEQTLGEHLADPDPHSQYATHAEVQASIDVLDGRLDTVETELPNKLTKAVADTLYAPNGGSGGVTSVNGLTGDVTLTSTHVGAAPASHNHPVHVGNMTLQGDLLPDIDNIRNLGSPELMWRDVYIGPGSLYINGQKILEDTLSGTIRFTADLNQNIAIQTSGSGDIELIPTGSGVIQLKGTVLFDSGSEIRTANGQSIKFDDHIEFLPGAYIKNGLKVDNHNVWHAGNFDPANYMPAAPVNLSTSGDLTVGDDLTVVGDAVLGTTTGNFVEIGAISAITTAIASTASTAPDQVLAQIDASVYRSGEFRIQAHDAANGKYHTATLLVVHNGVIASWTEYGDIDVGGRVGDFSADYFNGKFRLLVTPFNPSPVSYKLMIAVTKL